MKSGTIKLMRGKEIVFTDMYKSTEQWKLIIRSWMELYGDRIAEYSIAIIPDVIQEAIPKAPEKAVIITKIKKKPSNYKYTPLSLREKGNRAFYH